MDNYRKVFQVPEFMVVLVVLFIIASPGIVFVIGLITKAGMFD